MLFHMDSETDKPTGAAAGWRTLRTERPFRNKVFALREDEVELADRGRKSIAYLERSAGVVVIVPITAEGEMIMINHYRYPVDQWCLEVPAGGIDPDCNESPEKAARRELREEVGGSCERLIHVADFYSANALMDEKCHVYLAIDVILNAPPERGKAELMETKRLSLKEALALVRVGQMVDGQSALAILLCESVLRENYSSEKTSDITS
jgi:ADP-ribose pyrophosphatase